MTVSAAVPTVWLGVLQAVRAGTIDPRRLASLDRIIQITGPWIADAYYDPAAEDDRGGLDRFVDDEEGNRWLKTGDVAHIDAEGYITLVDRTKDLVKSGGEWISTVLEKVLRQRFTEPTP